MLLTPPPSGRAATAKSREFSPPFSFINGEIPFPASEHLSAGGSVRGTQLFISAIPRAREGGGSASSLRDGTPSAHTGCPPVLGAFVWTREQLKRRHSERSAQKDHQLTERERATKAGYENADIGQAGPSPPTSAQNGGVIDVLTAMTIP